MDKKIRLSLTMIFRLSITYQLFLNRVTISRGYTMRLLVLILNIVVSASLLSYPTEMLAASKHKSSHKSRSKGKHHRGHGKAIVRDPGNIWDRIRYGMRIPKPNPPQLFTSIYRTPTSALDRPETPPLKPDQPSELEKSNALLESKYTRLGVQHQILSRNRLVEPSIAKVPMQNYTRYGRQRLNTSRSAIGDTNATITQSLQNRTRHWLQPNPDYLTRGVQSHTRIRTQLAPPTVSSPDHNPVINTQVIAPDTQLSGDIAKTPNTPSQAPELDTKPPSNSSGMYVPKPGMPDIIDRQRSKEEELWRQQATIYGRFKKQVNGYTQRPDYLSRVAERSRPYIYHVVEELSQHNMPLELALLPVVESAYQATALSPMSAAGIWQFIPGTGRDFNLQQTANYDARLDVTASTRAAARFLSGLRNHFGDWLLALAAYNCGQGTVDAAISANRAAGLATDYWSLNLPAETMDYVPRLLAVAHIFANPAGFGVRLTPIRNEPYFVKVRLDRKADIDFLTGKDLTTVAQMASLSYEHFCRLNPGFIQPKLTRDGPFTFLMPDANANQLRDGLDNIAKFLGETPQLPKYAPVKAEAAKQAAQVALPTAISEMATTMPSKPATTITSPFISLQIDSNKTKP
jgi:soluble lytic murein transglycosylase-like protein